MVDLLALILIGSVVVFLAGLTQGVTGFGFALVSAPIMVIFFSPKVVVPIVVTYGVLISLVIVVECRRWLDLRRILPLMISGLAGIPVGVYLLAVLEGGTLKVLIGAVITLFALAILTGFQKPVENEKLAFGPVGFLSGVLGGSTSMGGPPAVLFFANQGVEKQTFRANLVAYFLVLSIGAVAAFILNGLVTEEVTYYTATFLPAMALGAFTGIKLANKVEEEFFQRTVLFVVIIAGILSVASGLGLFNISLS
ncbi:MAG: sulfite exporter TauE/SafE family protein [Archaeoglobaceae archaeon]